jgi:monovalent cation:H+ antiporter, CPA1 family
VIELTTAVLVIAVLLVVIGALQPVAERIKIPATVVLAGVGVAIGALASFLLYTPLTDRLDEFVTPIVELPMHSSLFIYVFLPLLLFQAALTIDVVRMKQDAAPILLLAVIAVIVTTVLIGVSLSWLFGIPLVICLLLGSVVATTDPAAVVGVFRDIGAPARLSRLVEGESLLNDAAAIAIFSILLGLLIRDEPFDPAESSIRFALIFLGGIVLGLLAGRLLIEALRRLDDLKTAETTLTVAAPYLVFIAGEQFLGVSGVVAVVTLGLCVSAWGKAALTQENWRHLQSVWEQVAFWAGSLVFILAALVVPRLVAEAGLVNVVMVLTLAAAALGARALVLFLLLPLLSAARLTKKVNWEYKTAILWGGLRGAVTLALALAVVENDALAGEVKQFVAVTATGFVLFTLFVNGTTLRTVIHKLRLDALTPRDQTLRDHILALSLLEVTDAVRDAGERYRLPPAALDPVLEDYERRKAEVATGGADHDALRDRERLAVALVALANRERELLLEHHGQQAMSPGVVEKLLRHAERIVEGAHASGRDGYSRAAHKVLAFRRPFRFAHFLHRHFRIDGLLAKQLTQRFEMMEALGLVLDELASFNEARLKLLFGARVGEVTGRMLAARSAATSNALEAMRLQYPAFAEALARRLVWRLAQREELDRYETLRREGLLSREVHDSLRGHVLGLQRRQHRRPRLDLGLKIPDMIGNLDLFAGLSARELRQVCRLFRRQLALPGEFIVRKGDRSKRVFFISSGAVEVRLPGQAIRRGRGDFFGELAVLTGRRRIADIVALGYCELLTLDQAKFDKFLKVHPMIREHVEEGARARLASLGAVLDGAAGG